MLKYLLFLFVFSVASVNAQSVCRVYQFRPKHEQERKLVSESEFDVDGRLIQERVSGYSVFLDGGSAMFSQKEDGLYEYYYDDTLIYRIVHTVKDDLSGIPVDSNKVFYYYDDNFRLMQEVSVKHLNVRPEDVKPGKFRTTVIYHYDSSGKLMLKEGAYGEGTREFFQYDSKGRVLTDSVSSVPPAPLFCIVTRYEYRYDGYREYSWMCDRKYPIINVYRTDEHNRVTEHAVWFHKNDERSGSRRSSRSMKWNDYLGNDFSAFEQTERTVTTYSSTGAITEVKYYYKGIHTTTHVFEYE